MSKKGRAKTELESLVREMLPVAKEALEEHGTFPPFGGALLPDGKIERINPNNVEEKAPAERLVEWLEERLRGGASSGGFQATVAIVNVQVRRRHGGMRDAVQVKLDHRGGASLELFFPYQMKRPGVATFGRAFSREGDRQIFEHD